MATTRGVVSLGFSAGVWVSSVCVLLAAPPLLAVLLVLLPQPASRLKPMTSARSNAKSFLLLFIVYPPTYILNYVNGIMPIVHGSPAPGERREGETGRPPLTAEGLALFRALAQNRKNSVFGLPFAAPGRVRRGPRAASGGTACAKCPLGKKTACLPAGVEK